MAAFILLAQTSTNTNEGSSNGGLICFGFIALAFYLAALARTFNRYQNDKAFDGLDKIIVVLAIPLIILMMLSGVGYSLNKKTPEE